MISYFSMLAHIAAVRSLHSQIAYHARWPHMPRQRHRACRWLDSFLGLSQSDKADCECVGLQMQKRAFFTSHLPMVPYPPMFSHFKSSTTRRFRFHYFSLYFPLTSVKIAFIYSGGLFTDLIHTHFDFYGSHLAHISQPTNLPEAEDGGLLPWRAPSPQLRQYAPACYYPHCKSLKPGAHGSFICSQNTF